MRNFRFRAWDTVKNEMVYKVGISPDGMPIRYGYQWFSPASTSLGREIMMFTGLHDKNDKEIWEGDIVLYEYSTQTHGTDTRFIVVFEDGRFCQKHKEEDEADNWYEWDELEVVGNIYENPELIDDKANKAVECNEQQE